jgi:DNA (cytosine-5)-methyltransferase 1
MTTRKKFTFIDLFAGCGGMSLGLENAGFDPVYVNELNPDALETYLMNRRKLYPLLDKFYSNDIKELVQKKSQGLKNLKRKFIEHKVDPGQIDLIVGGPPCQGYSGIGHRRLHAVDKLDIPANKLYKDMAKVIAFFKPRVFLFENVKGLHSGRWKKDGVKGEIFKDVLKTFKNIPEYNVRWSTLYAKNYGVPQNRPRIFIVGFKNNIFVSHENVLLGDSSVEKPDALEAKFLPEKQNNGFVNLEDLLGDLIDENYIPGEETVKYPEDAKTPQQIEMRFKSRNGRKIMEKGSILLEQKYSNHKKKVQDKFAFMRRVDGKKPKDYTKKEREEAKIYKTKKFAQRLLPARWKNGSGPWMTATSLPDDYVHYDQDRSLTVREWARIQTFPDWYQFAGKRTTGGIRRAGRPGENIHERELPKYTQIGNAVPVKLAEAIGKHFAEILKKNKKQRSKK